VPAGVAEKGDFSVTEKAFEAVKSVPMSAEAEAQDRHFPADLFLLERRYREGLEAAENLPDDQLATFPGPWAASTIPSVLLEKL